MVNVSCEYLGSLTFSFWGQGVLFPCIIFMSFIGLSGVYLEVKYLEFVHNLCNMSFHFYDTFHFIKNILASSWKFKFKMVLLFCEMPDYV